MGYLLDSWIKSLLRKTLVFPCSKHYFLLPKTLVNPILGHEHGKASLYICHNEKGTQQSYYLAKVESTTGTAS